jgi:hypothetical protein
MKILRSGCKQLLSYPTVGQPIQADDFLLISPRLILIISLHLCLSALGYLWYRGFPTLIMDAPVFLVFSVPYNSVSLTEPY